MKLTRKNGKSAMVAEIHMAYLKEKEIRTMEIITGKKKRPRRILLYGPHGIGKSTWASQAPRPLFLSTEDGLDDIGVDRTPLIVTFDAFKEAIFMAASSDYHTIVIDTVDWLERLIWRHVAARKGVECIDDIPYYRGYNLAIQHWVDIIDCLERLRQEGGKGIVLLAHSASGKVEPPDGESYTRHEPDLHKNVAPILMEWADEVLFAGYRVDAIRKDEGFDRKRYIAIGGDRVVYTCEQPTHLAKRRIAMPDEIALDWNAYAKCVQESYTETKAGNIDGIVKNGSSKPKEK